MYARAKRHFKKVDPKLYAASLEHHIEELLPTEDLFRDIIWTIIGQQLSARAADAIFARFNALLGRRSLNSKNVLALSEARMRGAGLSGAKVRAIRSFAQAVHDKTLLIRELSTSSDDVVLAELVKVKGIGPWTAQMVLMFSLARPDVFSAGDLGLRKGVMQLYGLKRFPDEKTLQNIIAPWSPYRTYAARVLWRVADAEKKRIGRKRPSAAV